MIECEQTKGQSVYKHGLSVLQHADELIYYLKENSVLDDWKLPDWLEKYKSEILKHIDRNYLDDYLLLHDCGKPYCQVLSDDGIHFPNHAETSKYVYNHIIGKNETIANWIGWDMVIHTANAEQIDDFCKNQWNVKDAINLLIAALSEVHSNAKMFGGKDSTSFKIKWKQISRRGNQICSYFFQRK